MDKAALRSDVRARRQARSASQRAADAQAIAARAVAFLPDEPGDITCFVSLPDEPGTSPLITALLERGHRLWLPQTRPDGLLWVRVDASTEYDVGALGISEPRGTGVESLAFAHVILMPALAVDASGRRLGQGGGYYDKALDQVPGLEDGGPMLVAIVHDDEVVDEVPTEPHDRVVDALVTPLRTLRTGRVGRSASNRGRTPGP